MQLFFKRMGIYPFIGVGGGHSDIFNTVAVFNALGLVLIQVETNNFTFWSESLGPYLYLKLKLFLPSARITDIMHGRDPVFLKPDIMLDCKLQGIPVLAS